MNIKVVLGWDANGSPILEVEESREQEEENQEGDSSKDEESPGMIILL